MCKNGSREEASMDMLARDGVLLSSAGERISSSVSQPLGRGPVPGPAINYTGPREVLLEFVILFF